MPADWKNIGVAVIGDRITELSARPTNRIGAASGQPLSFHPREICNDHTLRPAVWVRSADINQ